MKTQFYKPMTFLTGLACLSLLAACNNSNRSSQQARSDKSLTTPETVIGDMQEKNYERNPTKENARKMDHALAELDSEIRELQELVDKKTGDEKVRAQTKLDLLRQKRNQLAQDYNEAKYRAAVDEAKQALKDFGTSVKDAFTPDSSQSNPNQ